MADVKKLIDMIIMWTIVMTILVWFEILRII
jgi:hypothetical protein